MLRITIEQNEKAMAIKLEGRIAGPWAAELSRVWERTAPSLAARKLSIDLRDATYSDVDGTRILRTIYHQTGAELVSGTPWTQYLAEEVARDGADQFPEEA